MKHYRFSYFIGQAFKGLWKNGVMSLASIAVLMSCLVVIGGFSLLVININDNLDRMKLLNQIVVFTEYDATEDEIVEVENAIKAIPGVESVERTTKEQALDEMRGQYDNADYLFEDITPDKNPLSDSFEITYTNDSVVDTLTYQLEHTEGIRKVTNRSDLAGTMSKLKSALMMVFIWFLAVLVVVSLFVIVNTIKIAVIARKTEISVMRYVGAANWFITLPFAIEGIIIGIVSSVIAFFVERFVYTYAESMIKNDLQIISIMDFSVATPYLIVGFVAVGIITGVIGSLISLQKYLRD